MSGCGVEGRATALIQGHIDPAVSLTGGQPLTKLGTQSPRPSSRYPFSPTFTHLQLNCCQSQRVFKLLLWQQSALRLPDTVLHNHHHVAPAPTCCPFHSLRNDAAHHSSPTTSPHRIATSIRVGPKPSKHPTTLSDVF